MPKRSLALTPEALAMMDTIARSGSFAAAARELGKVPSALTYSVRQLEEALDVLLFDRSSRQAQLTAAGAELLAIVHTRAILASNTMVNGYAAALIERINRPIVIPGIDGKQPKATAGRRRRSCCSEAW